MKNSARNIAVTLLALAGAGITACASNPISVPGLSSSNDCALSGTLKLEDAAADAQSKLAAGCESQFSNYYQRLLQVGAGFPKADNAAVYQEFLRWNVNQGIVSRVQAGQRYDRYFSTTFSSLSGNQSVASSVCPRLNETLGELRSELEDKQTGLQGILGQQDRYQQATRLYYNLELNLHAACAATEV